MSSPLLLSAFAVMAEIHRRNVHVFNSSNGAEVAGFFQHGGVSISTFIGWINQVCHIPAEWALYPCNGAALDSGSSDELQPGRYVIRTLPPESAPVKVYLTTDAPRTRAYSVNHTHTPHDTDFVTRVRARDARCCITGYLVAGGDHTGFDAAHIFPLSEMDTWKESNYKRFIEDDGVAPGLEINSIQQGFLCSTTEHCMFNDYSIGVNPDVRNLIRNLEISYHDTQSIPLQDNYRIYDFVGRDPRRSPHGRTFYRNPDEQQRYLPSADLLRDHLRQCVLRHVKGAGESGDGDGAERRFDPDIDLRAGGFDLAAGSWWAGSEGKRQLEAELAGRLWGAVAVQSQSQSQSGRGENDGTTATAREGDVGDVPPADGTVPGDL
ncbi:hypothetical protein D9615_008146 [Tricholomella constricta]|uniref:HNH nuclease domain-containing protein n=1 Tax=Tricholomella constricta TaxID=117010 RepID=A0A8H5GW96_9AGAR|nr:hypothetical protein D9615_008146 [Tricholomella constricta]